MALAGLSLYSLAGENLIQNGDFSQGSKKWRGDINVEFETPAETNQVCKIELDEEDYKTFHQRVKTRELTRLIVQYKIKLSKDCEPSTGYPVYCSFVKKDGERAYMLSDGEFDTRYYTPPSSPSWKDVKLGFRLNKRFRDGELRIEVRSGYSGYIMIDDISVTGE